MVLNSSFWRGKSVFLTGHTGFKGGWTALWLSSMGAEVSGYSLDPPTQPNFFSLVGLREFLSNHHQGDVRDLRLLEKKMRLSRPSIVIHMGAQPLVRASYEDPVDTFTTNVIGTVNVLEAARRTGTVESVINVTSDKCYQNLKTGRPYTEDDRLGGRDPYSASKACSEIVSKAYEHSFLTESGIRLATARAGNVIGGGDWAADRLIPDCLRALESGAKLKIRYPNAIRPWQHVLEPVSGYLRLAEQLTIGGKDSTGAWNFGPDLDDSGTVIDLVGYLKSCWPGLLFESDSTPNLYEESVLRLDSSKANSRLGWLPRWKWSQALEYATSWYDAQRRGDQMAEFTLSQIAEYSRR